jgi:hypothetical protein
LFFTLIHFLLTYGLFVTILFSNNIHCLILAFVVLVGIRFSYYLCDRCILTLAEENEHYPNLVRTFSSLLTKELDDKIAEEIMINIGLLIVMNKLFLLMLFQRKNTQIWLPLIK